jgi:DNA-binding transcriptional LysR family regulator
MEPTPFARELAEPVRQALALLESALAHGPGFDPASATRAFRFYMSDVGQVEFLPPLVERVQREAPGVRLEAVALDVDDIGAALAAGGLDLAIGFLLGLGPPVRRRALFRDPYACLMRADHPIRTLTRKRFLEASFKALPPPIAIPPAEVAVHWHERFEADPGNRWLRERVIELFAEK